jgi:hypothetical protein
MIDGHERIEICRDPIGIEHFGGERQTLFHHAAVQKLANELHDLVLLSSRGLGEHWQLRSRPVDEIRVEPPRNFR